MAVPSRPVAGAPATAADGLALATATAAEPVPAAPSLSVAVTDAVNAPLSAGTNVAVVPVPLATTWLAASTTCHAVTGLSSRPGSVTVAEKVTVEPSTAGAT